MSFAVICLMYVAGMALLLTELFVPGIIIGFIGTSLLIGSIILAFLHHPPIYGGFLTSLAFVLVPTAIYWGLNRITLKSSQETQDGFTSMEEGIEDLHDAEGKTTTMLRPSGLAKINNKKVDVTAEAGMVIEKDVAIKVVKVEGNQVIVRKM